jgi:hypothetical protein
MLSENQYMTDARTYFDEYAKAANNDELWGFGIPAATIDPDDTPMRATFELPSGPAEVRERRIREANAQRKEARDE